MYTCPVCGFDKLWAPAEDDFICPSCGTQFGYTDATRTHSELRQRWIDNGKQWYSPVFPKPVDFNADFQLQKLLRSKEKIRTKTNIAIVNLHQENYSVKKSDYGDVVAFSNLFLIGQSGLGTGQTAHK